MNPELNPRVRGVAERKGLKYIPSICVDPSSDFFSLQGINDKGLYYIAGRLSDGKIVQETYWDFQQDFQQFISMIKGVSKKIAWEGLELIALRSIGNAEKTEQIYN